jgi:superfamily II DNA or RNA helicase
VTARLPNNRAECLTIRRSTKITGENTKTNDSPLIPYDYQERDIEQLISSDGSGIVATQVGGGKTLIAIEVAKRLSTGTNFVIAPKGTHKRAWEKTIKRQIPGAEVYYLNSTKAGEQALAWLESGKPGWYMISPEFFRKFHWRGIVPDLAVFDEVHRASNRKSKTALMLATLKAKRRIGMSGTVAGNKIDGLWSILKWIYPEVAGRSYWNWVDEYCSTEVDYFAGKVITGEANPGAIVASIPCYIRHLKREKCCEFHPEGIDNELPPVQTEVRTVELAPEQKRIYKKLEKELFVWLGENPLVVEVPVAVRVRLRQITLGVPEINEQGEVAFSDDCKSSKYEELVQIIGDHPEGEQMLVLTHSQKFAEVVTKRLQKSGYTAFEWSGKASQPVRDQALTDFISNKIQFIVAVISAIGEGTDGLQEAASVVVWLSKDDNRLLNEQAAGRLDRRGQKRSVISYEIIAEDTYDEGQLSNLIRNQLKMNESLRKDLG